jgi:integrase
MSVELAVVDVIERDADELAQVDFAAERESAEEAALNSLSRATRVAYACDWRAFVAWCRARNYVPLPAAPAVVAMYLPHAAKTLKAASIARRCAAIGYYHDQAGHASPMDHPVVKATLAGVRREIGIAQKGKSALTIDGLREVVAPLTDRRIDVRDRALLLLGFTGALRRSELVALNVGDVAFVPEGASVLIRRSKTDQEGAGVLLGVPFGSNPDTCPVRALQAWIALLDDASPEAPLFVSLNRHSQVVGRLCGQGVALIVRRRCVAVGLVGDFSGHSMRIGFVTTAASNGVDALEISNQTRHKSLDTVKRYARPSTIWKSNAAFRVGL